MSAFINWALSDLGRQKPIFESEAEFQHEFAYWLRTHGLNTDFERRAYSDRKKDRLDLCIREMRIGVELKLSTRCRTVHHQNRKYMLKYSELSDQCYLFVNDIHRLERLRDDNAWKKGYAILLSDNKGHWNPPNSNVKHREFLLGEGTTLHGTRKWGPDSAQSSTRKQITLRGRYTLRWRDYGTLGFKYLMIEVH